MAGRIEAPAFPAYREDRPIRLDDEFAQYVPRVGVIVLAWIGDHDDVREIGRVVQLLFKGAARLEHGPWHVFSLKSGFHRIAIPSLAVARVFHHHRSARAREII